MFQKKYAATFIYPKIPNKGRTSNIWANEKGWKFSTFDNSQWQRLHNSWSQKPMAPWGCQGSERKTKQVSQFPCGSILILTTRSLSTRFQLRCHYLYIYSNTLNIPPKKLSAEISWSKQLNFYFSWRFEIILFEDRTL